MSDTSDVCIPVEIARKAAIDLERYDGLKLQFPVLESIVSIQKDEISILMLKNESLNTDLDSTRSVLSTQIELTTRWQELSGTHKKQRNIALIVAGVLFVGVLVK